MISSTGMSGVSVGVFSGDDVTDFPLAPFLGWASLPPFPPFLGFSGAAV